MGIGAAPEHHAEGPAPRKDLRDYRSILSGTTQNIVGLFVAGIAQFAANILISRTLGQEPFGVVTVMTQAMFVLSFATRSGMDMAVLRDVAIEVGQGRLDRIRRPVARAVAIALGVSCAVGVLLVAFDRSVLALFSIPEAENGSLVAAAAVGLPFLALTNVWLGATRGLKIMRYTLYVFWAGQPIMWVLLLLVGWRFSESATMSVFAYSMSWALAAVPAYWFWRRESRGWGTSPLEPGRIAQLMRYSGPRAFAALFSQLLFWTDLFVLTRYASGAEVGVYSAALRAGQVMVLLLTSVSLMFSPFVADLHNRGEIDRLDGLLKTLTRWTLAATMPILLVLFITPGAALQIFGAEFAAGETALRILILGQLVNVATGSVGFVLIMVGRTGWDLVIYVGSLALDLVLALFLASRYGMEGAAIANAITFTSSNLARLALVRRFVHIWPYDRNYLRLLLPTLLGGAAMWAVHAVVDAGYLVDLVATALPGAVIFVVAYLAVGLAPAERRELVSAAGALRGRRSSPRR